VKPAHSIALPAVSVLIGLSAGSGGSRSGGRATVATSAALLAGALAATLVRR
jgi:hypothetical protein